MHYNHSHIHNEGFERYAGLDIPISGLGTDFGSPRTDLVCDSDVVLPGPSANTNASRIIGYNTTYGCCSTGVIHRSPYTQNKPSWEKIVCGCLHFS